MQKNAMQRCLTPFLFLLAFLAVPCIAEEKAVESNDPPGKPCVYETSAGKERKMEIFFPKNHDPKKSKVPGLILFHGGGWTSGSLTKFRYACSYFASRGLVCATAEYQLPDKQTIKSQPAGESHKRLCVIDAKSAIRWFKANAEELGIDPDRIITGGGSAGAHISAIATMNPDLSDPSDPKDIDTSVIAYLWFNPAFHPCDKIDSEIDILSQMNDKLPPTLVIFGDKDTWLPGWETAKKKWKSIGTKTINLRIAKDQPHGFFNYDPWKNLCILEADRFLIEHKILSGKPTLKAPTSGETLISEK